MRKPKLIPTTPDITLEDDSVVSVDFYTFKEQPKTIFALSAKGKTTLWTGDDYDTHLNDTEEQLETKLKSILDS